MEIVLKDRDQNDILSPTLTQWDQGVIIMIRDFLYPTGEQHPYLHFYNTTKQHFYAIGDQTDGNQLLIDDTNHTLTCRIPNQLLTEPYPITVHVYLTSGGSVVSNDMSVEARTVYTATIGVEPRMKPDGIIDEDNNGGEISAQYMRDLLSESINEWEDTLNAFYGTEPNIEAISCFYDPQTSTMYSDSSHTTEVVGDVGSLYRDGNTGSLYFYDTDHWVEYSVYGVMAYAKCRADACLQSQQDTADYCDSVLDASVERLQATFDAALDDCVIRISTSTPTSQSYGSETKDVITFVIGA